MNPFDGPVRLDVPARWDGRRTIRVSAGDDDAMMTVALGAHAQVRAAAALQAQGGGDVRILTDATGLHILGVATGPLDPAELLRVAYAADPAGLDQVAARLGAGTWAALTTGLAFAPEGTGGPCRMLVASTPFHAVIGLTDGESQLPVNAATFYVGVMPGVCSEEFYFAFLERGEVVHQGGSWSA
ncbi:hypothetical protein [Deinococcus rufus]|uniref:Aminomethyltransferase folate-binding domain-containing protein n=1 Tax=Deinococcus rufus TaxID=2136097 RepID=A0ABV7Z8P4_9DEIO